MSYSPRFGLCQRSAACTHALTFVLQVGVAEHGDKESKDLAARSSSCPVLPSVPDLRVRQAIFLIQIRVRREEGKRICLCLVWSCGVPRKFGASEGHKRGW
jgi:hypothetical protein